MRPSSFSLHPDQRPADARWPSWVSTSFTATTPAYTFDYLQLLGTSLSPATATWLMLGFFVAFAVKLPAVPLHTWLPDAHTEAPTRRQRHPGRPAPENRCLRSAALRGAPVSRGGPGFRCPVGHGPGASCRFCTARCWPSARPISSGWWPTPASATWDSCCWGSLPGTSWPCRAW